MWSCLAKGVIVKKKIDISREYTKEENMKCGRKGYCQWKKNKISDIPINKFGEVVSMYKKKRGN